MRQLTSLFQKKISFLVVIFFIIAQYFLFLPQVKSVFAADYSINYYITYTITPSGATQVDYDIKLTNLTDNLYATSQSLTTTQTDIYNISVSNVYGIKQNYTTAKSDTTTTITTNFSSPAVGQGSYDEWNIKYYTNQIASESGHAWHVLIPGFGDKKALNIDQLEIDVVVPSSFGDLGYASPKPHSATMTNGTTKFVFSSDQINTSGINMILGTSENYAFSFNYPISNSDNLTQVYTIAVPADTRDQQVSFTHISPKPDSFTINADGNYILSYKLAPKKTGLISVNGIAQVNSTYHLLDQTHDPVQLSSAEVAAYTAPMKYWETTNPQIKKLAADLTKGDTTPTQKARHIYDYLVKTFQYNRNALYDTQRKRKGALYAITHPNDVICQEYVDAFVALARASEVPAQFIAGYGNTLSPLNALPPNVLHAWAEYYDPVYGWVPVDPTWGSTSGSDYFGNVGESHFAIATYGHDSANPVLVLSFISQQNEDNTIKLIPTDAAFTNTINYTLQTTQTSINAGIFTDSSLQVQNTGNRVLYLAGGALTINSNTYKENSTKSDSYIFPTMTGSIIYPIQYGNLLTKQSIQAHASLSYGQYNSQNPVEHNVLITISIMPAWYIGLIPILAVILIFVISYTLVNLFIKLHHRFAKE